MIAGSIARRYAKALLEIGIANKTFDALHRELERACETLQSSPELASTLDSPVFPLSQRKKVLDEIVRRLGLSPMVRNFLQLLLDRGRIAAVPSIAREHRLLVDEQAGRIHARVSSPKALPPATEAKLKAALERRTGKTVVLEKLEDPSLLGGVVTQVGDLVFDGSVRTKLAEIRQRLIAD